MPVRRVIVTGIQDALPFPKNKLYPIKARKDEWQAREKEMARQPGGRAKFEKEFRAMMNTLATEHFGARGPEVLKKLPGWKAE